MSSVAFEVSTQLLPPALIPELVRLLSRRLAVHLVAVEDTCVRVRVTSLAGGELQEEISRTFCESVTTIACQYWTVHSPPAPGSPPLRPYRSMDLSLHLVRDGDESRIILAADLLIHPPASLMRALSALAVRASVMLESTNPVDRTVVVIRPHPGIPIGRLASDILQHLLASEPSEKEGDSDVPPACSDSP